MAPPIRSPEIALAKPPSAWSLIGRQEELALCESCLVGDRWRGVVIAGAPGVGKTRLMSEALGRNRRMVAALQNCEYSPGLLVVPGRDGSVDFAGPDARQLLHRYFGRDAERSLPEAVRDWLQWEKTRLNGDASHPLQGSPLTFDRGHHRLIVRRVGDVLLLQEDVASLTRREREILGLVAQGCSNADIAAGLWISPGTVRIHLQHIYEKLGVGSRTAAVARSGQLNRIETD